MHKKRLKARGPTWREKARAHLAQCLPDFFSLYQAEEHIIRFYLREHYPWRYRQGFAYEAWLNECRVARQFIYDVAQGKEQPHNYMAYSKARFGNAPKPRHEIAPGQLTLL